MKARGWNVGNKGRFRSALILVALSFTVNSTHAAVDQFRDNIDKGRGYEAAEKFTSAEDCYWKAKEAALKSGKRIDKIEAFYRLTNNYVLQRKFLLSEKYYKELMKLVDADHKAGKLHRETMVWLEDLADAYTHYIKDRRYIAKAYENAVHLRDIVSGDNNDFMVHDLRELSGLLISQSRWEEALPYTQRLVKLTSSYKGPKQEFVHAGYLFGLSQIEYHTDRLAKAETDVRDTLEIVIRTEKPPGTYNLQCQILLGKILVKQKQFSLAEDAAKKAERVLARMSVKPPPADLTLRQLKADIALGRGKYKYAISEFKAIVAELEKMFGKDCRQSLSPLRKLKDAYAATKDKANEKLVEKRIEYVQSLPMRPSGPF